MYLIKILDPQGTLNHFSSKPDRYRVDCGKFRRNEIISSLSSSLRQRTGHINLVVIRSLLFFISTLSPCEYFVYTTHTRVCVDTCQLQCFRPFSIQTSARSTSSQLAERVIAKA